VASRSPKKSGEQIEVVHRVLLQAQNPSWRTDTVRSWTAGGVELVASSTRILSPYVNHLNDVSPVLTAEWSSPQLKTSEDALEGKSTSTSEAHVPESERRFPLSDVVCTKVCREAEHAIHIRLGQPHSNREAIHVGVDARAIPAFTSVSSKFVV